VFLGDSIFDYWGTRNGSWFPYKGWVNRGVGGQTTSQMLEREQSDVFALHPKAVVLEGGNNDMRLGMSPEQTRDNIRKLGELAEAQNEAIFVAQMTPVCDCFKPVAGLRTVERIRQLNQLLRIMCFEKHWEVIDLYTPLADVNGLMTAEYTVDGVHPNDRGYAVLAPVVDAALSSYR
jgi:lysophospholipase L1-like esterase